MITCFLRILWRLGKSNWGSILIGLEHSFNKQDSWLSTILLCLQGISWCYWQSRLKAGKLCGKASLKFPQIEVLWEWVVEEAVAERNWNKYGIQLRGKKKLSGYWHKQFRLALKQIVMFMYGEWVNRDIRGRVTQQQVNNVCYKPSSWSSDI